MDNGLLNLFLFDPEDLIARKHGYHTNKPFPVADADTRNRKGLVQTCPTLRYKQNAYRHKRRKRHDKKPTGIPSKRVAA